MKEIHSLILIAALAFFYHYSNRSNTTPFNKIMYTQHKIIADTLKNKGIGSFKEIRLDSEINEALAKEGQYTYEAKCSACHKINKSFVGPALKGIFEKRSPEWIMNMILNPEEMMQQDSTAMALQEEYHGIPMPNQELTTEEARAILEYFRTL